uniref:Tc1-like transposase DDE domain-containing protein n=1 Tax=Cyprinus carpio TaxID=7962 RepID=A0A8C2EN69_CYPCA
MGKKGDLSNFERGMVVGARWAGLSISQSAQLLGFSRTTISRVYKEWCEKGKTSSMRQSCGRKCLVDARGQRRMGRLIQADRRATLTEITTRYNLLLRHSDGRVMDPSCLVTTVQAGGGGVMVWGMFSWHTLGPLVPIGHRLNATAYLSIVSDHVHPFMTTMYPSSDGYFQQDNAPCHKARIISNWFLEHDNEFTILKWPPQSPDLNPIEHLWDVVERELRALDVHPTNLHQLQDAILSIWANISKECFQHLFESMPHRIKV